MNILLVGIFSSNILAPSFLPFTYAVYTESTSDTFLYYKEKLQSAIQDIEYEFRVNNAITDGTITNVRNLVNEAYQRLPDDGESGTKNTSIKKSVDLYLDLAQKSKSNQTHVVNAAQQVNRFINEVNIQKIEWAISANPATGNAPLTTSFAATAKDPSWVNIPDSNYIWWSRERGGSRREIGRGPSLTYTFSKEWSYQVFLDVVSDSRNSKGKIDVLPATISQDITVSPRLGNVILLVNGVNVSNLDQIKVSPALAKIGLLFDATASRAVSNGKITKTEWDFANGNTTSYDSSPIVERQPYVNEGVYKVKLNITTNQGQTFSKNIDLIVRDPAAVISTEKDSAFIGEEMRMSATTYLSTTANVEYKWEIQAIDDGKKIISNQSGKSFNYTFQKVGQYLVSLTSRSPNGNTDTDTKVVVIESHPPTVNLDTPKPASPERPNTFLFDASRSFDLDTKSAKWLTYSWVIDGEKVGLTDASGDESKGYYSFSSKGQHTVSLTVANSYGKVTTIDKNFDVTSLLHVGVNVTPRVAPIGSTITFQARSPNAKFFEWNLWDGSPAINGTTSSVQYAYKKTGIYTITLTVKWIDGSEQNTISRNVYVTDTDKPYALIDISDGSRSVIEDPTGCKWVEWGAFIVNRALWTSIDGSKSINVDGNNAGLTYTWRYLDRIKTGSAFSEKFRELWCFPVELTVRSEKTGASHTTKRYIEIKNLEPKLTSVTAIADESKKDSQKILVNVTANGAKDEDGVITSYIWYYTTESDSEKQNVRITQSANTTFVLPNVTEKYYFGVIIEDNDGARVDSQESLSEQNPLLIANDDANINMPLISLSVDKSHALTEETLNFSASAKDILGKDITHTCEYFWDFDGDGRVDQKTTEPRITYVYKKSGKYNMKLKVINNGTSNTKYQAISIKNELKASLKAYRIGNSLYLMNTSRGSYDRVEWKVGNTLSENLYSVTLPWTMDTETASLGTLTIKSGASEISSVDILPSMIETMSTGSGILLQTTPSITDGKIIVESSGDKLILSAFGNTATNYIIDTDTKIDSDLDGTGDNDKDNIDTPSYTDGSAFAVNIANARSKNREIKISMIGEDGTLLRSQLIPVIFSYIQGSETATPTDISGSGVTEVFGVSDKKNLDSLQTKIRTLPPDDRIIFTQHYNTLIENWGDLYDRTQWLLNLQREVSESPTLDTNTKGEMSSLIDLILVGDAQATNEVSVASRVIEWLIKLDNPDRDYIIERLEKIKSHPGNLTENTTLWEEILKKVQTDTSLSNEDKILLKSQLKIIVSGGSENVPVDPIKDGDTPSKSGNGVIGFMKGAVQIFGLVLATLLILIVLGYIFYRLSRKSGDIGFQDFLIDSIAHHKPKPEVRKEVETVVKAVEMEPSVTLVTAAPVTLPDISTPRDPLAMSSIPDDTRRASDPLEQVSPTQISTPDWLKPLPKEEPTHTQDLPDTPPLPLTDTLPSVTPPLAHDDVVPEVVPEAVMVEVIPQDASWRASLPEKNIITTSIAAPPSEVPSLEVLRTIATPSTKDTSSTITPRDHSTEELIPDWLRPITTIEEPIPDPMDSTDTETPPPTVVPTSTELPDWLKASLTTDEESWKTPTKDSRGKKPVKSVARKKKSSPDPSPPSENTGDIPDWLK
jgi:PKD repeat protein